MAGEWQPIETAPMSGSSGPVDIWAKSWRAAYDDFVGARFTDCLWMPRDSMTGREPYWSGVPDGWLATHWMLRPEPPVMKEVGNAGR